MGSRPTPSRRGFLWHSQFTHMIHSQPTWFQMQSTHMIPNTVLNLQENQRVVAHYRTQTLYTVLHHRMQPLQYAAAAAAKLLQSCQTLCDPIDGSPWGSPVPGILQARTLEWVAISFSNAWKWKVKVKSLSLVWLSATPWTAAHQAPPSMGFSRQECWSGVPLPSPVYLCTNQPTFASEEPRWDPWQLGPPLGSSHFQNGVCMSSLYFSQ